MTNAVGSNRTLLKIGDGGDPETFTTIAEVLDITGPALTLDTHDVTSHSSPGGYEEFIGGVLRTGEVTFEVNFIPTDSTQNAATGLIKDMVDRTKRNFQMVFPDPGSTTWSFTALVTGFTPSAPVNGPLRASVTLKVTGQPALA